jgi:hypothetical protein
MAATLDSRENFDASYTGFLDMQAMDVQPILRAMAHSLNGERLLQ